MKSKLLLVINFLFLISVLELNAQIRVDEQASLTLLKENLNILASDDYAGRETTTNGEILASSFIADKLEKSGVKAFGDNNTYFQNFELLSSGYDSGSKIILFDKSGSQITELVNGEDFVRQSKELADASHSNQTTALVFAGYGISAEEFNYDDYADIDVTGKTIIVLNGEPYSQVEEFFNGDKPTKYSDPELKIRTAKEKGAAGILFIADERIRTYWKLFKDYAAKPTLSMKTDANSKLVFGIPVLMIGEKCAQKLFDGEKESFEKIDRMIKEKDIPQAFELNKKLTYSIKPVSDVLKARNVIGLIEGSDPILKNEYVVISAHFDHEGIKNGVVFNGADDDGSGTVAVLEAMHMLADAKENKRSILGVFHTGEEKGLFGSKYAAENGSFIKNVVADINMDMVGRESVDSLHCIGSDKLSTEYAQIIKDVNKETVNFVLDYKYDNPNDPERFYYRSDHYNYAVKGIPVVFFFDDMRKDYHKATDDVDKINFEKILKTTILSANLAIRVANLDHKLIVDKK